MTIYPSTNGNQHLEGQIVEVYSGGYCSNEYEISKRIPSAAFIKWSDGKQNFYILDDLKLVHKIN